MLKYLHIVDGMSKKERNFNMLDYKNKEEKVIDAKWN